MFTVTLVWSRAHNAGDISQPPVSIISCMISYWLYDFTMRDMARKPVHYKKPTTVPVYTVQGNN